MIKSVADLLKGFLEKETQLLKSYDIVKHPGIIGDMYEGLTKEILHKSIFDGLDLRICAGKIKNSKNNFSGEIDCMLVVGDGEKIPYTDKFIYDSSKVVAVIQVKKNLYSKDLKDSFTNLKSVVDITEERDGEKFHSNLLRTAYRAICQTELPNRSDLEKLPFEKQMLFHILTLEAFYPARIVWGYNGFKSEYSLRNSMINFLEKNISTKDEKIRGFDPLGFPNLIICENNSLIKNNGIPFAYPIDKDLWWPFLASSPENPVYFFLEVIWTRLHFMYGISSEIFGEDLKVDELHGFLLAKAKKTKKNVGWEYMHIDLTKEELEKPLDETEWEPSFLDNCQFVIINKLCKKEELKYFDDKELEEFVKKSGYTLKSFAESLKATGLVDIENGTFKLITDQCLCGISSTGKYFAGENKTGRVERWSKNEMKKQSMNK
ncbi:DUF6602 domain-containing protein [Brumimicrobium sp.]|uniref:DUF6602 domain-containing protein n=1 Tax=Brumimicrobium sp. TaxID=2029867 RepID=UPI003A92056F